MAIHRATKRSDQTPLRSGRVRNRRTERFRVRWTPRRGVFFGHRVARRRTTVRRVGTRVEPPPRTAHRCTHHYPVDDSSDRRTVTGGYVAAGRCGNRNDHVRTPNSSTPCTRLVRCGVPACGIVAAHVERVAGDAPRQRRKSRERVPRRPTRGTTWFRQSTAGCATSLTGSRHGIGANQRMGPGVCIAPPDADANQQTGDVSAQPTSMSRGRTV